MPKIVVIRALSRMCMLCLICDGFQQQTLHLSWVMCDITHAFYSQLLQWI